MYWGKNNKKKKQRCITFGLKINKKQKPSQKKKKPKTLKQTNQAKKKTPKENKACTDLQMV